jgi:hypothetical protein
MWLPRTPAGWTIAVFGALALVLGLIGLISPEALLAVLGFPSVAGADRAAGDYTVVFLRASAMASFNVGVYYLLAAATEWRPFYRFTIYFRLLTFAVFTALVVTEAAPARFLAVGLWEALGAVATALALRYEAGRSMTDRQPS